MNQQLPQHGAVTNGAGIQQVQAAKLAEYMFNDLDSVILAALKTPQAQYAQNPTASFKTPIKAHLKRFSGTFTPQDEATIEAEITAIATDLQPISANAAQKTAIQPVQELHSVARYQTDALNAIEARLQKLSGIPGYDQQRVRKLVRTIQHEIEQDKESHESLVYKGLSNVQLIQSRAGNLDAYIADVKRATGITLTPEFANPLFLNRNNIGGAVKTMWDLVAATDINEDSAQQPVKDFDGRQSFYNPTAYDGWLETTANALYRRQVFGLNSKISATDSAQEIARKTDMVNAESAEELKTKLNGLNTANLELDGNPITPARIILRMNKQEQDAFFDKYFTRKIGQESKTFLRAGFDAALTVASLKQIMPYIANRQAFDKIMADPALKTDMETSIANAPAPYARQLWDYRGKDVTAVDAMVKNRDDILTEYNRLLAFIK